MFSLWSTKGAGRTNLATTNAVQYQRLNTWLGILSWYPDPEWRSYRNCDIVPRLRKWHTRENVRAPLKM